MKRWKLWLPAVLLVFVGAGALVYWLEHRELNLKTVPLERGVEVRVFGIGSVEAQIVSKVGFQITGKLVATDADQGDVVPAGTLLAKLDDASQRAKVRKSEVAVRQAEANLLKVRAQGDRANTSYQQKKAVNARRQALLSRGSVAIEIAEDAQSAEEIAATEVRVSQADGEIASVLMEDAKAQNRIDGVVLDQHQLRAPFEARIIARHKELGSVVAAGEPVFTIVAVQSVWVKAYVDEAQAGGLRRGQTAWVRLRSEPGRAVETEIIRIDQEDDRVTEERKIYVRCRACTPQHQLRYLGEQAEVEIVKGRVDGRFVPVSAIDGFDGHRGGVWLIENGRLRKQQVDFGERLLDGRVQIASGLPDGAEVVAERAAGLREGRQARSAATSGLAP